MSQVIRVSTSIYDRLESLAQGFDTPGNVIERLITHYEQSSPKKNDFPQSIVKILSPEDPDDLTHTKIINGHFGKDPIKNWNHLVYLAHASALRFFRNVEKLQKASQSNIVKGQRSDSGYREYPDLGISIQGENANNSWSNALWLAKKINTPIELLLEWKENKKAIHPGKRGKLIWEPQNL